MSTDTITRETLLRDIFAALKSALALSGEIQREISLTANQLERNHTAAYCGMKPQPAMKPFPRTAKDREINHKTLKRCAKIAKQDPRYVAASQAVKPHYADNGASRNRAEIIYAQAFNDAWAKETA